MQDPPGVLPTAAPLLSPAVSHSRKGRGKLWKTLSDTVSIAFPEFYSTACKTQENNLSLSDRCAASTRSPIRVLASAETTRTPQKLNLKRSYRVQKQIYPDTKNLIRKKVTIGINNIFLSLSGRANGPQWLLRRDSYL